MIHAANVVQKSVALKIIIHAAKNTLKNVIKENAQQQKVAARNLVYLKITIDTIVFCNKIILFQIDL